MWHCLPDGRDPRSPHGNYPLPHFQGDGPADAPPQRSTGEFHARAIPGTAGKHVLIDGGHHAVLPGSPFVVTVNVEDDGNGRGSHEVAGRPGRREVTQARGLARGLAARQNGGPLDSAAAERGHAHAT